MPNEGRKKPGRPRNPTKIREKMPPGEMLKVKEAVLLLIEAEEADNITEACRIIGISPLKVYHWAENDAEWAGRVRQAQNIKADRLEADLDNMNNPVARIFRLKKLRPEYRDSYKFDITSEPLEKLLKELRELGQNKKSEKVNQEGGKTE